MRFTKWCKDNNIRSENDQSLRGIFLDGCVFDETQSIKPTIFPEVIRPALADRKGWCVFIGTPKAKLFLNYTNKQKKTKVGMYCLRRRYKILDQEERAAKSVMSKNTNKNLVQLSSQ